MGQVWSRDDKVGNISTSGLISLCWSLSNFFFLNREICGKFRTCIEAREIFGCKKLITTGMGIF